MRYELTVDIPGLPETINEVLAMKLRARMSRKAYWKEMVWGSVQGKKPPAPIKRAQLTLTRFSSTRPDPDGLTSTFKHLIDGLVIARVLENDRFENIGFPTYLWESRPKGKGFVRIHLVEVQP